LVADRRSRSSTDVPRRAELHESANGLITITGGKLTTWRPMAKRTVDRVVRRQGSHARCRTQRIALAESLDLDALSRVNGVPTSAYPHLADRYGRGAREVLAIAASDPRMAQPIVAGHPDLIAEAAFAARHEQARSIGDVLLRRTRLGLLAARELCDPTAAAAGLVAEAMARELGWDDRRTGDQIAAWEAEARAEGLIPRSIEPVERLSTVR
jgi:glycerol-3-phosphate dehydrogenase